VLTPLAVGTRHAFVTLQRQRLGFANQHAADTTGANQGRKDAMKNAQRNTDTVSPSNEIGPHHGPLVRVTVDTKLGSPLRRTLDALTLKATCVRHRRRWLAISLVAAAIGAFLEVQPARGQHDRQHQQVFHARNESGEARTINAGGFPVVAPDNPFFLDLGANGRRCVTCHQPADNMSVSPEGIQMRFELTNGTDPIFRANDGANSPLVDVSTVKARRAAYSMLLTKGLIRVGLPIPSTAEFELAAVSDPYGYAGHNDNGNELSLFRRPLPSTNLAFLSTVMWDGRETIEKGSPSAIHYDLAHQSNAATQGHAQAPNPIDDATRELIVAYEMGLYTAQISDHAAGSLRAGGAHGGPEALSTRLFTFGENDPLGCDPAGANCVGQNPLFDPIVFSEYSAWAGGARGQRGQARAAVARGQDLFNTLPIPIAGVSGINDDFGVPLVVGTCTTCHDMPHAGNHSVPAPLNIGVAEPPIAGADGGDGARNRFGLPVGDMPVYTLRNKTTGETKDVTDPGRALITGKWKDVGRFKGPILRGLAGRAPYFHNGAAATLLDVVEFYNTRFGLELDDRRKADLVAFLRAL
jgi:cytochrome c peroxidase